MAMSNSKGDTILFGDTEIKDSKTAQMAVNDFIFFVFSKKSAKSDNVFKNILIV